MRLFILMLSGLSLFFIVSCAPDSSKTKEEEELDIDKNDLVIDRVYQDEQIVGIWQTQQLKVKVNSMFGGPVDTTFNYQVENFMEQLGIYKSQGLYRDDHTYVDEYYGSEDSLIFYASGTWRLQGDTLITDILDPQELKGQFRFKCTIDGDLGTFSGMLDWDKDGLRDDEFVGISKHFKLAN